jgi:hypothetical protein
MRKAALLLAASIASTAQAQKVKPAYAVAGNSIAYGILTGIKAKTQHKPVIPAIRNGLAAGAGIGLGKYLTGVNPNYAWAGKVLVCAGTAIAYNTPEKPAFDTVECDVEPLALTLREGGRFAWKARPTLDGVGAVLYNIRAGNKFHIWRSAQLGTPVFTTQFSDQPGITNSGNITLYPAQPFTERLDKQCVRIGEYFVNTQHITKAACDERYALLRYDPDKFASHEAVHSLQQIASTPFVPLLSQWSRDRMKKLEDALRMDIEGVVGNLLIRIPQLIIPLPITEIDAYSVASPRKQPLGTITCKTIETGLVITPQRSDHLGTQVLNPSLYCR